MAAERVLEFVSMLCVCCVGVMDAEWRMMLGKCGVGAVVAGGTVLFARAARCRLLVAQFSPASRVRCVCVLGCCS